MAKGTFLLVIFACICYDGFESQLRNDYLLECDCLFDCNWHIGTIKWETKTGILGWRDRGSNSRITGRCHIPYTTSDSVNMMVSQELNLALTPNQVVFLCWKQDWNPSGSQTPNSHTYIHTYIHTCMYACMHARTHARMHACRHIIHTSFFPWPCHMYQTMDANSREKYRSV